jgi:hypothetical protein
MTASASHTTDDNPRRTPPEWADMIAHFPDTLNAAGGDLHHALLHLIQTAWHAGRSRGLDDAADAYEIDEHRRAWDAHQRHLLMADPALTRWFTPDPFAAAMADAGYALTRTGGPE